MLVTTHDTELQHLLGPTFLAVHFVEDPQLPAVFDYRLHPGISTSKNAIKLLEKVGFPPAIVREAQRLADACTARGPRPILKRPSAVGVRRSSSSGEISMCQALLRSRDQNPLGALGTTLVHRHAVTSRRTSLLIYVAISSSVASDTFRARTIRAGPFIPLQLGQLSM